MYAERHDIALTTNSGGACTAYSPPGLTGRVLGVTYTKTDFADGSTITITSEATGAAILTLTAQNSSGSWFPRPAVHDATGGAIADAYDARVVVNDRVKVVVASGGNAKTGTVTVVVG